MGSNAHGSEEVLAEEACARIGGRTDARVLVGGLGMGYTLAAALRCLEPSARVVVAELVPAVVAWNRGPLAHLAGRPLEDPRAAIFAGDVRDAYAHGPWDAILIDVDNGPAGLLRNANHPLYTRAGLRAACDALRPGGIFGVWSIAPNRDFNRSLARVGFDVEERETRARRTKGSRHTLWFATRRSEPRTPSAGEGSAKARPAEPGKARSGVRGKGRPGVRGKARPAGQRGAPSGDGKARRPGESGTSRPGEHRKARPSARRDAGAAGSGTTGAASHDRKGPRRSGRHRPS